MSMWSIRIQIQFPFEKIFMRNYLNLINIFDFGINIKKSEPLMPRHTCTIVISQNVFLYRYKY